MKNLLLPADGVRALASWFRANAKPYLFRREPSAYSVWILEVMTQQTQIARAEERHRRWLTRFPNIAALADAPLENVLKEWEGLGYYARARNIHRTARLVVAERGALPETYQELSALPGIGKYTAASIASIVHGEEVAAIDANVRRIIARLAATPLASLRDEEAQAYMREMFRHETAAIINESLMELGEQICRRQSPDCFLCPLALWCKAAKEGGAEEYTRLAAKSYQKLDFLVYCILRTGESSRRQVLAEEVPAGELWAGLWRLPYIVFDGGEHSSGRGANPRRAYKIEERALAGLADLEKRSGLETASFRALGQCVKHSHTKYRITLHPFLAEVRALQTRLPDGAAWHTLTGEQTGGNPRAFPSAFLKVMALLS